MSKQDGVAIRNAADLERKYQFGKQFAEVLGIANDARGAVSEVESVLRNALLEQSTSIARDTEKIVMTALQEYTKASDIEELKKTLRSEFEVSASGIEGRVSAAETKISNVNNDLQEKFNLITKYFTFDINGLLIGALDADGKPSPNKVVIDNDDITILVNNVPVQEFKADGTSLIPILNVTKQLKVCGLTVTEDDSHINCDYLG